MYSSSELKFFKTNNFLNHILSRAIISHHNKKFANSTMFQLNNAVIRSRQWTL
jgi:hypothetical protein